MGATEAYLLLLFDNFMAIILLPPHRPYVLDAMHIFGGYNKHWIFASLLAGAFLASFANFLIGRAISTGRNMIIESGVDWFTSAERLAGRFGFFILLAFSWIPAFGAALVVLAGVFRVRFYLVLLACLISYSVYYLITMI